MSALKCILVADVPAGVRTVENVIGTSATVIGTNTLDEAVSLLRKGVDLLVCGIHFDDSRMFDLLRLAKADPSIRAIPFLCFWDMDSELTLPIFESLQIACQTLGAVELIDRFQMKLRFGSGEADERFRRILTDLLTPLTY
jgi:hypothetical protein